MSWYLACGSAGPSDDQGATVPAPTQTSSATASSESATTAASAATAAAAPSPALPSQSAAPVVQLTVEVIAYRVGDLTSTYDDGTHEWFDGTELKILAPVGRAGQTLHIYHQQPVVADSPWRTVGTTLRLAIERASLDPPPGQSVDIFSGGVRVLPD